MNFIKIICLSLILSTINSGYDSTAHRFEDCSRTIFTWTDAGNSKHYETNKVVASSANDCKNREILDYKDAYYYPGASDDVKFNRHASHCCYMTFDNIKGNVYNYDSKGRQTVELEGFCVELHEGEYKNIKEYINYLYLDKKYLNLKIDCNSYYLKFGFLSLILFLF